MIQKRRKNNNDCYDNKKTRKTKVKLHFFKNRCCHNNIS